MKLVLSVRARRDLAEIGDWIARNNPERAISYVLELSERCRSLIDFPHAYPEDPNLPGTRRCAYGSYLIRYRVRRSDVFIVSIRHRARQPPHR